MGQMNHTFGRPNRMIDALGTNASGARGIHVVIRRKDDRWTRPVRVSKWFLGMLVFLGLSCFGCKRTPLTVAVIPRTCGTALWEPEHAGAAAVARSAGLNLYWNAPMRDDDMQTQISLIEKSVDRGMAGIIISPIQTLPMRTPIRRVVAQDIPVVVIDTELGIPSGPRLGYVLNDEHVGGRIAARRVGQILGGEGSIAIVGMQPELHSNTVRERSFESTLNAEFPGIHIVARRLGLPSMPQEQHNAEELLAGNESLDAIVALSLA